MCYFFGYLSCMGLNLVIILLNLICFYRIHNRDTLVRPFVVFTILVQIGIAINFFFFIRPHFEYDYVRSKKNRRANTILNRRVEENLG